MTITVLKPGSPRLAVAAASKRTEQGARYKRVLGQIADRRRRGERLVTVKLADLEALIAIVATIDIAIPGLS